MFELSGAEREAYARDGFVMRAAVFSREEVRDLCEAAEAVVASAERALPEARHYAIDGNEYAEARVGGFDTTVQLEHAPGSRTLRARSFTPTPRSRSARSRSALESSTSTCSRSPGTSSTRRRA